MPLSCSELDGARERYEELEEEGVGGKEGEMVMIITKRSQLAAASQLNLLAHGSALFVPVNLHCGCQQCFQGSYSRMAHMAVCLVLNQKIYFRPDKKGIPFAAYLKNPEKHHQKQIQVAHFSFFHKLCSG